MRRLVFVVRHVRSEVSLPADLSPVIAAGTQWMIRAFPPPTGAMHAALAEAQARQAVTVAAWLRYPTALDADLLHLLGPGGSARLDTLTNMPFDGPPDGTHTWRTWVDEVVVSWAACLLADPDLAVLAVDALRESEHASGLVREFRKLTSPDAHDRRAAVLLRHPDLVGPVAALHRAELMAWIRARTAV
jgi:hypothetical protein